MTNLTETINSWFELQQRQAEKTGKMIQKNMEEAVDIQVEAYRALGKGLETPQNVHHNTTELTRELADDYFTALQTSVDEWISSVEEAHKGIEQGFNDLQNIQNQAFSSFDNEVNNALQTYNEFTRAYIDTLSYAFDTSIQGVEPLQETVRVTERVNGGQKTNQEVIESIELDEPDKELAVINGIGPTYMERLENAGIQSIRDLAVSTPDEVAEAADVTVEEAHDWIKQAAEH